MDHLYGGNRAWSDEDVETGQLFQLFAVAQHFQTRPLAQLCQRRLAKQLNPDNCLDVYRLAHVINGDRSVKAINASLEEVKQDHFKEKSQ